MGPRLLPAEKVELQLRPSAWAWAPRHLLALAWVAWGAILLGVLGPGWADPASALSPAGPAGPAGPGNDSAPDWWAVLAAAEAACAGPLAMAAVLGRARHRWGLAAAVAGAAVTAVSVALALAAGGIAPLPLALACAFAAVGAGAAAWGEARRATTFLLVSNLRLVATQRWPRSEAQVLHTDLTDLDLRQGPLGRRLDMATLVAVRPDGMVAFPGVRPAARVRRLVQLLVRRATATEYLREQQRLDTEVAEAMAALHRR